MSTSNASGLRALIVGLDGATFDNLKPWIDQGCLPTFKKLLDGGVHGALRSSLPPITAPSWTSFMTGMNPGKHGVYNFIEPLPDSYELRYTNARSRHASSVWQILSEGGLRVGAINVPMTYPPEPVSGFMVSGMDAPEGTTSITHPPELHSEIQKQLGRVSRQLVYLGYLGSDERRDAVLKGLQEMDEHYAAMTRYLLEAHPVDLAMVVFTSSDTVQHFFMQYLDPKHPQHDPRGAVRYRDAILKVYQRLDGVIAQLLARLPEDGSLLLMSDHGFMSTSGRIVHLNRLLEELGLLVRHRRRWSPMAIARPLLRRIDTLLRTSLSAERKAKVAALLPGLRRKWESQYGGFADIDWAKTRAFCYEVLTPPPGIWINVKGRRPHGVVEPGPEYDRLCAEITERLLTVKDPVSGQPLIRKVYRKEEIYSGPQLDQAPDLTVNWWEGITFIAKPSFGDGAVVDYVGGQPLAAGDWGGTHALDGIVTLYGKPFRAGVRLDAADITDVVPTLLFLLGQPIPEAMDGRVLLEAFTPEFTDVHPVRKTSGRAAASGPGDATYTEDEAAAVAERLQGLGYMG